MAKLYQQFHGLNFFSEFPRYSGKVGQKKEKLAISKRYALQVNAVN